MCLIIKTDNPDKLSLNLLNTAYENNSDGFGIMFCNKGKLHTHKIVPKTFKDVERLWKKYKDLETPMGLHFRFNTNGDTTRSLSHPFQILSKAKGDDRDLWVMHNGPQLPTPMIDDNKSDTHQFVKWILKPQLSNEPELLYNHDWQEMLADLIGSDKLLFLDSKTEEFTIINEEQGKTTDDMWLSNTYSLQPTGTYAMSRDYEYDMDTDKLSKKPTNYWYDDDEGYDYNGVYRHNDNWSKNYVTKPSSNKALTTTNTGIRDISINGTEVDENDLYGMTKEEVYELVQDNPMGISEWVHDLVYQQEVK